MKAGVSVKTTGMDKFNKFMNDLQKSVKKMRPVKIGYFSTAKYPTGQSVASIAVHHEFGAPNNNDICRAPAGALQISAPPRVPEGSEGLGGKVRETYLPVLRGLSRAYRTSWWCIYPA